MNATMSCTEVAEFLAGGGLVIDLMTPEDYAACHLAGALNACVYEMVFLDRIAEAVPDIDTPLVVYDTTGESRTALVARERLVTAGYATVSILHGGLAAWIAAGLPVAGDEPAALHGPALRDGSYRIDTDKSMLEWIGRNLNNRHQGRIEIQGGELVIGNGQLSAGSIIVDMTTITNLDLQDSDWRNLLISHLKSDDFFGVERFPTASFRLTGWQGGGGGEPEAPRGMVTGTLSIRDVTRPVSFPAVVAPQADGSVKAHGLLDIDRTLWNVGYGSGRLFERLGMHLVHDIITMELFIVAR